MRERSQSPAGQNHRPRVSAPGALPGASRGSGGGAPDGHEPQERAACAITRSPGLGGELQPASMAGLERAPESSIRAASSSSASGMRRGTAGEYPGGSATEVTAGITCGRRRPRQWRDGGALKLPSRAILLCMRYTEKGGARAVHLRLEGLGFQFTAKKITVRWCLRYLIWSFFFAKKH